MPEAPAPTHGDPGRVDFYVLPGSDGRERLKFACRIAEKAFLAGQRVFVCHDDARELAAFDDLLWTFGDRSFVPHAMFENEQQWHDTPVLLGDSPPPAAVDVLLNLGGAMPETARPQRIIEIVDADAQRRQAGRAHFRHYRERGIDPQIHHVGGEPSA